MIHDLRTRTLAALQAAEAALQECHDFDGLGSDAYRTWQSIRDLIQDMRDAEADR